MKKLLWFGPATICLEWFGVIYLTLAYSFDSSLPISQFLTANHQARPFGIALFTVSAFSYGLFAIGLANQWRWAPYIAAISGVFFSLTAINPFKNGSFTFHDFSAFISVILYLLMMIGIQIYSPAIRTNKAAKYLTILLTLLICSEIFTMTVSRTVYAATEILVLIAIHAWTLLVFKDLMWPKDRIA